MITATVPDLFFLSGPSAVGLRVRAIVVDAINRVASAVFWFRPHIFVELNEVVTPFAAHRYASCAIPSEFSALWVFAPVDNRTPHFISTSAGHSVAGPETRQPAPPDASATLRGTGSKMPSRRSARFPTVASTSPIASFVFRYSWANYDQYSEPLAYKIKLNHVAKFIKWAMRLSVIGSAVQAAVK